MEPFVKIPIQENKFVPVTAAPNLKCMQTQVLLDNGISLDGEWKEITPGNISLIMFHFQEQLNHYL